MNTTCTKDLKIITSKESITNLLNSLTLCDKLDKYGWHKNVYKIFIVNIDFDII